MEVMSVAVPVPVVAKIGVGDIADWDREMGFIVAIPVPESLRLFAIEIVRSEFQSRKERRASDMAASEGEKLLSG